MDDGLSFEFEQQLAAPAHLQLTHKGAQQERHPRSQQQQQDNQHGSYKRNFKKTVCSYWLKGLCMKGDECGFLHEYDVDRMPLCRTMLKYGKCEELDCPYKHDQGEIKECNMYRLGFCIYGPQCRYKHVPQPGPPPAVEAVEAAKPREHRDAFRMGGYAGGFTDHERDKPRVGYGARQDRERDRPALPWAQQQPQQQQSKADRTDAAPLALPAPPPPAHPAQPPAPPQQQGQALQAQQEAGDISTQQRSEQHVQHVQQEQKEPQQQQHTQQQQHMQDQQQQLLQQQMMQQQAMQQAYQQQQQAMMQQMHGHMQPMMAHAGMQGMGMMGMRPGMMPHGMGMMGGMANPAMLQQLQAMQQQQQQQQNLLQQNMMMGQQGMAPGMMARPY